MKKSLLFIVGIILLGACDSSKNVETMTLGGVEYDSKYVRSGYYFDKASLSEATLADMLSKVEVIEKPENLGKVQLPDFASIELEAYPMEEVDDLMIEAEIERERDLETVYNPVTVKREAKDGDKVIIDFKGFVDGEELEGGSGEDFELILGSGQFIPGFEEGVIGHTAGKKFNIDVTFPEDYTPELQGKPAKFEITIKSIEEPVTPEVNEEFIAKHSTTGAKTIDEYKIEVRERVEKRNEFTYNQSLSYQLYDIILTEGIFEPTEEALAWGFSTLFSQMNQQAEMSGTDIATVLASNGSTVKQAYDEIKAGMPEFIKPELLLDALSDRYKIELSEEEVKTWTENLLVMMGYGNEMTYEEYKNSVGYEALLNNAKFEKALLRAVKECKLVEITEEE